MDTSADSMRPDNRQYPTPVYQPQYQQFSRPPVQPQNVGDSPHYPQTYVPQPQTQPVQYRPQVQPSPPVYRPPVAPEYRGAPEYARPQTWAPPQPRLRPDDEDDVVTGRMMAPRGVPLEPRKSSITSPEPVITGRYVPPSADQLRRHESPESRPYERLQTPDQPRPASILIPNQYQQAPIRPPQSFTQPLEVHRPAQDAFQRPQPPTSIDLNAARPQQPYNPVGLNNLITPTRVTPSPGQQVTFRLPHEDERRDFSKKFDPRQQPRVTTPTSESFRRYAVPATPEYETPRRVSNWGRSKSADRRYQGDNDSGVDESTQEKQERNGGTSPGSPLKSPSKIPTSRGPSTTPRNNRSRSTSKQRLTAKTPESPVEPLIKKVPMNKIQVGAAPSPNLKQVRSKIGSLENATHKPGGGNVKIETRKVEVKAAPRIEAKNEAYQPKGGEKSTKLQWNAKSKIGSLENANHKPGGGDRKIEEVKLDFKNKAKPKIGSLENATHVAGGGDVKIVSQKIDIKAQSKIGSLDNVKHRPGGGDKKIFDDKEYLKNVDHPIQPTPPSQSPTPASLSTSVTADENLNQQV